MARRSPIAVPPPEESREDALLRRAARHRKKGDERRAMVMLREAALENEDSARIWVMYGVQCARIGRREDARRALQHAAWVHSQNGHVPKANVTRALLKQLVGDEAA
jgi:Flp pilus assembly protein TadD